MAETAFRGSTATSGAIDTDKKTGLKKTPVTFADFDAKMRSYGGSLPPGFDPRAFDIGGEGAIPGDTSMFPRMGKKLRGTGFPDKSELYESREAGPSPRFDPTSSVSAEEAARAAERSYAEAYSFEPDPEAMAPDYEPSYGFEPDSYDSTPEGMSYRRDPYSGEMMLMPDERKGSGFMRSGTGALLDSSMRAIDPSLLDPAKYGASGVGTESMKAPGSGGSTYGDTDPFAGIPPLDFDPAAYSPGLVDEGPELSTSKEMYDMTGEEEPEWVTDEHGITSSGYEPYEPTEVVYGKLAELREGRRKADPLWELGAPSAPLSGSIDDSFSRYYVPGEGALGPGYGGYDRGMGKASAKEHASDAETLAKRYGWGYLTTGERGDLGSIPEGMTRDDITDAYMEGVTGIDSRGKKWYGDPEGYARGDAWTTPSMYDPETGTFAAPTSERKHKDYFPSGPTPGSGYTAEGDHYVRPLKPTPREGLLERGGFLTRGTDGTYPAAAPGRYAFSPESGEYHYPSGVVPSSDTHPMARSDRLKDFYGEEAYGKLRTKDGKGWASDAELTRRAEEEGWKKGGTIEGGKFVPEGGYIDEDGVVWGPDGYPLPEMTEISHPRG